MSTLIEQFVESPDGMRVYQQERAIHEVTGLIEDRMDEQGISRSELAALLGKSRGWVTQLLDGETNKTIRTLADVLAVLGHALHFKTGSLVVSSLNLPNEVSLRVVWPEEGEVHWPQQNATPEVAAVKVQHG